MQHSFFQAICRVGIFMICAQAIVHFRPQEAYEKYLKLLVGIMTLIQLILPIGSFFAGGGRQEAEETLKRFGLEMEESIREAEKNAALTDELLQQMTLKEVLRQAESNRSGAGAQPENSESGAGVQAENSGNGTGAQAENRGNGAGAQSKNEGNKTGAQPETDDINVRVELDVENVESVRIGREG